MTIKPTRTEITFDARAMELRQRMNHLVRVTPLDPEQAITLAIQLLAPALMREPRFVLPCVDALQEIVEQVGRAQQGAEGAAAAALERAKEGPLQ